MEFWQRLMQKPLMTPRARSLPHGVENHRLRAIGFMALATLCFAALDSTGKYTRTADAQRLRLWMESRARAGLTSARLTA